MTKFSISTDNISKQEIYLILNWSLSEYNKDKWILILNESTHIFSGVCIRQDTGILFNFLKDNNINIEINKL